MGAYAASKFAMEAVTDALRQEVFQFGVSVSAIEPGFIKTPLVSSAANDYERNWDQLQPNVCFPLLLTFSLSLSLFCDLS